CLGGRALAACLLLSAVVPAQTRNDATGSPANPSHEEAAQASKGAAPGQPTAPSPETAQRLAKLPKPLPPQLTNGINVDARSKEILRHLSQVIAYYRMAVTPIQKTGQPSDTLYAQQAETTATQIAQLAFQSARDEAALLARIPSQGQANAPPPGGDEQRLRNAQQRVTQRIQDLQSQQESLEKQMTTVPRSKRAQLSDQLDGVRGQLELATAESEALAKVFGLSATKSNTGLESDIDKLQHSVPEVIDSSIKPVANTIQNLDAISEAGVINQGEILFQLISTEHAIDARTDALKQLHQQATDLRTPLVNIIRATLKEGNDLENNSAAPSSPANSQTAAAQAAADKKTYDQLTDAFKAVSSVSIPISQEMLLLEQAQGNLASWRSSVDTERAGIMHSLLIRLAIIVLALLAILAIGEAWRRAVTRYVQDIRRRRQLLVIRRMAIGFLSGVVIILGAVTQFSSLATFAGFVTAGLAVGLQTVLLSVAAYFFIVGRYGVRVGDRITVANVTGDVIEVGLFRFYMLELAGLGSVLHHTGRVAVFANSVLFQTGTPLYKQIPGTNYAWHEVSLKLKPGADRQPVLDAIQHAVEEVFAKYKDQVERQHSQVEAWMDTSLPSPKVESRLAFSEGLKFTVLYPVLIGRATEIDQRVVESLLHAMAADPTLAQAIDGSPEIAAVVKT
ncbi:MAG: mechanosensitive ion channel family protein, partial [Terracidiphilus sp.]